MQHSKVIPFSALPTSHSLSSIIQLPGPKEGKTKVQKLSNNPIPVIWSHLSTHSFEEGLQWYSACKHDSHVKKSFGMGAMIVVVGMDGNVTVVVDWPGIDGPEIVVVDWPGMDGTEIVVVVWPGMDGTEIVVVVWPGMDGIVDVDVDDLIVVVVFMVVVGMVGTKGVVVVVVTSSVTIRIYPMHPLLHFPVCLKS